MNQYKKVGIIIFCVITIMFLTSCDGYNRRMYSYLCNENNYKMLEVQVNDIYFQNVKTGKREQYVKTMNDKSVLKGVTYFTGTQIDEFFGRSYITNAGEYLEPPLVFLEIIEKNSKTLLDENFFDNYVYNDYVKIYVSNYIYMDTDFFYIISVEYNGVTYLEKSEGLKNVCRMMDENRSLI